MYVPWPPVTTTRLSRQKVLLSGHKVFLPYCVPRIHQHPRPLPNRGPIIARMIRHRRAVRHGQGQSYVAQADHGHHRGVIVDFGQELILHDLLTPLQ